MSENISADPLNAFTSVLFLSFLHCVKYKTRLVLYNFSYNLKRTEKGDVAM